MDFGRISSNDPLPIASLRLLYPEKKDNEVLSLLHATLLPHLNPTRCEYTRTNHHVGGGIWTSVDDALPLAGWTRIRTLRFEGTVPYLFSPLRGGGDIQHEFTIGLLPAATFAELERIEVVVPSLAGLYGGPEGPGTVGYFLSGIDLEGNFFAIKDLKDRTVVLEVDSEEEKVETEKLVAALVRTREKFRVVLVQ